MGVAPMERKVLQLTHRASYREDLIAMRVPFATAIVVAVHVVR
jgi:hypothetical protein